MKRGCSGDDDPSDSGRLPGRDSDRPEKRSYTGKGKGRAKTPPRLPSPLPEMSDGQGAGRSTENVVREAVAAMMRVSEIRVLEAKIDAYSAATGALNEAFCAKSLRRKISKEKKKARKKIHAQRMAEHNARMRAINDAEAEYESHVATGVEGPATLPRRACENAGVLNDPEASCVPLLVCRRHQSVAPTKHKLRRMPKLFVEAKLREYERYKDMKLQVQEEANYVEERDPDVDSDLQNLPPEPEMPGEDE